MAQKSRQALKLLEAEEFDKVVELQEKSWEKDSLNPATAYVFAKLYSTSNYTGANISSAHEYMIKTRLYLDSCSEDHKKELEKSEIEEPDIHALKELIDAKGYQEAVEANSIESCEVYLNNYTDSKWLEEVTDLRDNLAFDQAQTKNTWEAYYEFVKRYPDSKLFDQADQLYDSLFYQEKIENSDLNGWQRFIQEYPESSFVVDAEVKIIKHHLADFDVESLKALLPNIKATYSRKVLLDVLYSWSALGEELTHQYASKVWQDSVLNLEKLSVETIVPILDDDIFRFVKADTDSLNQALYEFIDKAYLCGSVSDQLLLVKQNGATAVVNRAGEEVISGEYLSIEEDEDGIVISETAKGFGAFHLSGLPLVPNAYESLKWSGRKYFIIETDQGVGLINYAGEQVLSPKFDAIDTLGDFWVVTQGEDLYLTKEENFKSFDLNKSTSYEEFERIMSGYAIGYREDEEVLINQQLNIVSPLGTKRIWAKHQPWVFELDSTYLVWDQKRNYYDDITYDYVVQNQEWIATKRFEKWNVKSKRMEIEPMLGMDSVKLIGHDIAMVFRDEEGIAIFPNGKTVDFEIGEELLALTNSEQSEKHFLIINRRGKRHLYSDGEKLFETSAKTLGYVTDEYFSIHESGKYGMVNKTGQPILRTKYDAVVAADQGLVSLLYRGKFGSFDLESRVLLGLDFDEQVQVYVDSLIQVKVNGKYGIWNRTREEVLAMDFNELVYWTDSSALVSDEEGLWAIYDFVNEQYLLEEVISYEKIEGAYPAILYKTAKGYGVYDQANGVIVPDVYADVINLGSSSVPIYFAEKSFPEAEYNVVVYYNEKGEKLKKAIYSNEQFDRLICD